MRAFLFCVAWLLSAPFVAIAQDGGGARTQTAPAANPTREAIRDIYQSIFFDSGVFDRMMPRFYEPWRNAIQGSDYYRTATPAHRRALDALPPAMSDMLRRDIISEADVMAFNVAPAAEGILSPEEIRGMAAFFRDPQWHDFVQRIVDQTMDEKNGERAHTPMTPDEQRRFAEFERTPIGQALARNGSRFIAVLSAELNAALVRVGPRLQVQLVSLICDALEDQCTEGMRQAAHQT